MTAKMTITRANSFTDRRRNYNVILDAQKIGTVSEGDAVEFPLSAGPHSLSVTIDWCSSSTFYFSVTEGETKNFVCGSNLPGLKAFFALWYIVFARKKYLKLCEV